MYNNEWNKGKYMGEHEQKDIAVLTQKLYDHDDRLDKLEKGFEKMEEVRTNVAILVNKFSTFQPNCPLHQLKMDGFENRLNKVEESLDSLWKKILVWSGIAAVILFLLTQLVVPYVLQNIDKPNPNEPRIELYER